MNDLDRWVGLEGPPPAGVRELLDVLVPPLSPEHEAALDRRLQAAIAEERRREARRQEVKCVAVVVAAAAVAAAGVGVALHESLPDHVRSAVAKQAPSSARSELRAKALTAAPDAGTRP